MFPQVISYCRLSGISQPTEPLVPCNLVKIQFWSLLESPQSVQGPSRAASSLDDPVVLCGVGEE